MPIRARITALIVGMFALVAALLAVLRVHRAPGSGGDATPATMPSPLYALADASGWLGGDSAVADSLANHPVLMMVWADTDPVSLDRLPDAQAWLEAYGRYGLRVVGVHVPEYSFAADSTVPAAVLKRLAIRLPVALDAGYRIGSRLGVGRTLPVWLLVDPSGSVVFRAEGDHVDRVHHAVRALLRRLRPDVGIPDEPEPTAADPAPVRRVFCGTSRVNGGPLMGKTPGVPVTFTAEFRYQESGETYTPYPVGRWTPSAEGVTSARGGAGEFLAVRYDAGSVSAVLSAPEGHHQRVWVLCDETWLPESLRGADVRADARGATYLDVDEARSYAIAREGGGHVLKLSPEDAGVTFHDLAFRPGPLGS